MENEYQGIKDPEFFEFFKHREIYDAYRLQHALNWLREIEFLVFKSLHFDYDMIDKYAEGLKKTKHLYRDDIDGITAYREEDILELERLRLKIVEIIEMHHQLSFFDSSEEKLSDILKKYPIDISMVNKEYSFQRDVK